MDGSALQAEVLSGKSFTMCEVVRVPSISRSRLFIKQQRLKATVKRQANISDKIKNLCLLYAAEKQSKETSPPYPWYKRVRGRLPSNCFAVVKYSLHLDHSRFDLVNQSLKKGTWVENQTTLPLNLKGVFLEVDYS